MNRKWMYFGLVILLVVGFPRLIFYYLDLTTRETENAESTQQTYLVEEPMIQVLTENGSEKMKLNDYLVGVLLCEIPADFHMEAQKAQAVVARTYAIRTVLFKNKHDSNAICTDPDCCQGYLDPESYLLSGGDTDRIYSARSAVTETDGLVLTYENQLIDATYFSCSGGQTEDALAVWGVDIPYLQSVSSPGEEIADHYWDSTSFSSEEFQRALGRKLPNSPNSWFGASTYTAGGGVACIEIGGKRYSGTELRTLLRLRSTAFSVEVVNDTITIITRGFGHRVGMSQYGAQAMALGGRPYNEILAHYYPGTVIDKADFIS